MQRLLELVAESEGEKLDEAGKSQYPFKNKRNRGPAVDKGWKWHPFLNRAAKFDSASERWDCSCSNYKCTCTDDLTDKTIKFQINKGYKKAYNKRYRQWLKDKAGRKAAFAAKMAAADKAAAAKKKRAAA